MPLESRPVTWSGHEGLGHRVYGVMFSDLGVAQPELLVSHRQINLILFKEPEDVNRPTQTNSATSLKPADDTSRSTPLLQTPPAAASPSCLLCQAARCCKIY